MVQPTIGAVNAARWPWPSRTTVPARLAAHLETS
jgi:hypothetical protein